MSQALSNVFKLHDVINVKDPAFGAKGDGVTDDTAAIQAAINALGASGGTVFVPRGRYRLTSALNIASVAFLRILGEGGIANNSGVSIPVSVFYCKELTTYTFTEYTGLDKALVLEYLAFDGRNGASFLFANASTTWQGVVKAATSECNNLYVKNVDAFGSQSLTPMWDLRFVFDSHFENCEFMDWSLHSFVRLGQSAGATPAVTFTTCTFRYARECVTCRGNILDVHFFGCMFESSVVFVASENSTIVFQGCHFEGLGLDNSQTGLTTGISPRNFDLVDSPPITGNVTAGLTTRYGHLTLDGCSLTSTIAPAVSWFEGVGKGNVSSGGTITLKNCMTRYNDSVTFFVNDANARGDFEYEVFSGEQRSFLKGPDARLIAKGRFFTNFSNGSDYLVKVDKGRYRVVPQEVATVFNDIPTIFPTNGWNIGDIVERQLSTQAAGKERSWINLVAGSPGKWDTHEFTPVAKNAQAAGSGGTMDFNGVFSGNSGEFHLWEVWGDNAVSGVFDYHAIVALARTTSRILNVTEHFDGGTSAISLQVNADAYTLRVTNSAVQARNYYAKLIRVYRTHT